MDTHSGKPGEIPFKNSPPPRSGSAEAAQPKTTAKLRFVARGSSPSEDDPTAELPRRHAPARESIGLNLSESARRRRVPAPPTAGSTAIATPSPTTQIAARMHSINLKSPMGAFPLGLTSTVTCTSHSEELEDISESENLTVPQQASDDGEQRMQRQTERMDTEQARRPLPG